MLLTFPANASEVAADRGYAGTIVSTATAIPPHSIGREEVKTYMRRVFSIESARLDAMMSVIDNSQVKQRYCIHPIDYIIQPRPLAQSRRNTRSIPFASAVKSRS